MHNQKIQNKWRSTAQTVHFDIYVEKKEEKREYIN